MAYVYDGTYRYQDLVVTKTTGGSTVSGYPKTYSILDSFVWDGVTYPLLGDLETGTELSRLSVTDYNTRLAAFRNYVEDEETGISLPTDESNSAYGTDTITCVIGAGVGGSGTP